VSKVLYEHLQLYVEESALFMLFGKSFGALCESALGSFDVIMVIVG